MPDSIPSTSHSYVPILKNQHDQLDKKLHIIEWNHMSMAKFYPMALAASWSIRGILYPLNVVKSRLQLQKQNQAYRGTFHAFKEIYTKEGPRALFRGFWITLPQIIGSFVYSTIYEKSRSELHSEWQNGSETLNKLVKEEGLRTFTKGLGPRMMNNGLQSLLIMTGYETIKRLCVLPEYRDAVVW